MLTIDYEVHSCVTTGIEAEVEHQGRKLTGTLTGITVELVTEDEKNSQTLHFIPDDLTEALALFAPGSKCTMTITPASAKKPKEGK